MFKPSIVPYTLKVSPQRQRQVDLCETEASQLQASDSYRKYPVSKKKIQVGDGSSSI